MIRVETRCVALEQPYQSICPECGADAPLAVALEHDQVTMLGLLGMARSVRYIGTCPACSASIPLVAGAVEHSLGGPQFPIMARYGSLALFILTVLMVVGLTVA